MNNGWMARIVLSGLVVACCAVSAPVRAQTFPTRPITLIVPYGPGTGTDVVGRIIGQKLTEEWGQPFVVRNLPGASGAIGAEAAATAAPDGHTLVIMAMSHIINQLTSKNVRDVVADFTPVAPAGGLPIVLAVPASSPARSMKELVAIAKARPGEINYAALTGSATHFLGLMLGSAAGIDIRMVSYKSTTDAVPDVLNGQVQIWFTTVASAIPQVNAGKVRALGITSGSKRASVMPDVPSMVEAGFPALDINQSLFFQAPAKTPQPVVLRLNGAITRAMGMKDVHDKLADQGMEPGTSTPAELGALLRTEVARWTRVVKESGIRTE